MHLANIFIIAAKSTKL